MVLLSHAGKTCNFPGLAPDWTNWIFNGPLGVRIFFVISGFIITLLLLKEEHHFGRFSIRGFYLRRVFRIIPVYYSFLFTILILDRIYGLQVERWDFVAALTFTSGWWPGGSWLLGHTWSLSVEEQFYLLWPPVLWFVQSPKKRIGLLMAVLAAFPFIRVVLYLSPWSDRRSFVIVSQGDAILFGCLLALGLFYFGPQIKKWLTQKVMVIRLVCLSIIFVSNGLQSMMMLGPITVPFSNSVEGFAIAVLMGTCILNKDMLQQVLNSKVFVFVGTISYSWYLWQQLFLFDCGKYFQGRWFDFPFNVGLSFVAATLSYFLIERNFLKLKERFSNSKLKAARPL